LPLRSRGTVLLAACGGGDDEDDAVVPLGSVEVEAGEPISIPD
jgi:hypothetical protein